MFVEIDPPIGENILSYRGSHDVVLRNLVFVGLITLPSATSLGLVSSRWATLANASFELIVDDNGRRNRRSGLNMLTSLSLSVNDESPREGICNRPLSDKICLLGFAVMSIFCPDIRASFSSGVSGK